MDLLAKRFESGGGHASAAGLRDSGDVNEFYNNKFLKIVEEHLKGYK